MNKKYCASLELSKRLKELGFPQKTDFYWCVGYGKTVLVNDDGFKPNDFEIIAAPHCGELGMWLPPYYATVQDNTGYKCFGGDQVKGINDKNEANARAKMLIYLAEHGLIDPKNIK